jgi:uncharacterized protein (TIGR00251 family)
MIRVEPHPEGAILPVRAHPGARRSQIQGEKDGSLKVYVTQTAEKGKANKALVEVLARRLSLRRSQIELCAGETSRNKRFLVRDVSPAELLERIGPFV